MKNKLIQIAIDGPAGAGKTTVGQLVAAKLGITYLSTGRIFRSYACALKSIDCKNQEDVRNELSQFKFEFDDGKFYINGVDVSMDILSDIHSMNASLISSYPFVRKKYEKDVRKIAKKISLVMDGRDIGTVILPDSPFKFYLDASLKTRATRRAKDLRVTPKDKQQFAKIMKDIEARDKQDMNRPVSPLKKAPDAIYIDSDNMTAEQVTDFICDKVNKTRELWKWSKLH